MTANYEALPLGEPVYYTGDMANVDGWGHIVNVRPPDKWSRSKSYDIALDDGRTFQGVYPSAFSGPGHRFITAAEYQEDRRAKIAAFQDAAKRACAG